MKHYTTLIFDYGNTLIEFSKTQLLANDRAFHQALVEHFGPLDFDRLHAVRMRDRRACYEGTPPEYREADMHRMTESCVRELYACDAAPDVVEALVALRRDAFVRSVAAPEYLHGLLGQLRNGYRLGLLSNYVCGTAIRRSLDIIGITDYFDAIVVSADVGYVKPHPVPFERILAELRVAPSEALFVGDNWLADVQGAKRAGMDVCLTRQFLHYEEFHPEPSDRQPDYRIQHLQELPDILNGRAPR
jgi:putative hydrolase of the HAD superfamily